MPSFSHPESAPVLGTPIAIIDYQEAVRRILTWAREKDRPMLVAAANTHVVTLAAHDEGYRTALERFDLIVPDGMPVVWYLNYFERAGLNDRVYGPELMLRCLADGRDRYRHFFLGGSDSLRKRLQIVLKGRFPDLVIAGGYSPPFGDWDEAEDAKICRLIQECDSQIVWVGLGCPRQEKFLNHLKSRLPPGVYLAVGAAFPLISGAVRQAPAFFQKRGLEWAFRVAVEPRRLWKRYLVYNSLFLWAAFRELIRRQWRRIR